MTASLVPVQTAISIRGRQEATVVLVRWELMLYILISS